MIHDANMMPPTATAATPLASNSSGGRKKQRRFTSRKHSQTAATSAIHFSAADASNVPLTSTKPFLALVTLLALALTIQFAIVFSWHHKRHDVHVLGIHNNGNVVPQLPLDENVGDLIYVPNNNNNNDSGDLSHLEPHIPHMPPIMNVHRIPDPMKLKEETLSGHKPTIAGVAIIISEFLTDLHRSNEGLAIKAKATGVSRDEVHQAFVHLAKQHLLPFEEQYTYAKRPIFPIRKDDSIFISLASFRDHLLSDTLKGAFDQAKYPEKLYVGAIVQNCFGLKPYEGEEGVQCRTGAQVVGKNKQGRDTTKVSDAPPDRNGIEEFCNSPQHKQYCDNGQVRVLYLHENESLGPAMARYYASKLWGGETYFVQTDSHLEFYQDWDELYTNELKATKAYPKSVLSSYPPGFQKENGGILEGKSTPGARLCTCEFSSSDVESKIIRINTGVGYHGEEERPTQIPFIAAGFFFASAEFLVDVPFDPYMPWCFMGEEIMLSMRAWTSGWSIYAPRNNWIAHQYRPGRMGLPKFWGSVGRLFGRPGPGFSNQLQLKLIKRVKFLVGYKDCCTREKLEEEGSELVLQEVDHYGFGNVRTREEYLEWAQIDVDKKKCHRIEWCNTGSLE
jgi:[Skp1-protein]-hydroxyproline N-acetylglucosaminyltransferase